MPRLFFAFFGEWISYAAGMLSAMAIRHGWEVEMREVPPGASDEVVSEWLDEIKPDLVALSLMTMDRRQAFQVARLARERKIKTVAGGVHASVCPDDLLESGLFDAIVRGDGMGIWPDILEGYKGLNGTVVQGAEHRDLSLYHNRFFSDSQKERMRRSKMFETMTALGCPYTCTFCSTKSKPFIKLPIEAVARQIVQAHKDFGIEDICIRDDMFILNLERVKTFRKIVQSEGLDCEYRIQSRANHLSHEVVAELKALGVESVNVGVESTSDRLLKFLDKGITGKQVYTMAETLKHHGLGLSTFLLFGLPTQDRDDYNQTLDFVRQIQPYKMLCHYFLPLPGSRLFQYCFEHEHMPADFTFDDYPLIQPNQPQQKSYRGRVGMLNNVDYELGASYMERILDVHHEEVDRVIHRAAIRADQAPWIVVGASDYLYRVLERLSLRPWKNLLGYYDYESAGDGRDFLARLHNHSIPIYRWAPTDVQPEHIVVTKHEGRTFRRVIEPFLRGNKRFCGSFSFASTLRCNPSAG